MPNPLLSVVIPVYNGERFLKEAVDSILKQKYEPLEIIIINDGSTDKTREMIESLNGPIVAFHQDNAGQAVARNVGLRHARGAYIALLDADDVWTDDHLVHLMNPLVNQKEIDFTRGLTRYFRDFPDGTREYTEPLFMGALVGAALYRREVFDRVGLFDEEMQQGEDFDWNIRLAESGCVEKRLQVATLLYRRHDANLTNDKAFVEKGQIHAFRNKIKRVRMNTSHE